MTDYGLHISTQSGIVDLQEPKDEFFTAYGKQGYQITKRKENVLDLKGFILANSLADFKSKRDALENVFKAAGTRSIVLEGSAISCYAKEGFKITGVHVFTDSAFAKFQIKLIIV